LILLDLFDRQRDGIQHEGMGRLAGTLGRRGNPGFQVIFDADGGGWPLCKSIKRNPSDTAQGKSEPSPPMHPGRCHR